MVSALNVWELNHAEETYVCFNYINFNVLDDEKSPELKQL
jgi:hypothetical protein